MGSKGSTGARSKVRGFGRFYGQRRSAGLGAEPSKRQTPALSNFGTSNQHVSNLTNPVEPPNQVTAARLEAGSWKLYASPMSLAKLDAALTQDLAALDPDGRTKAPERVIVGYRPPEGTRGPRYRLSGSDRDYIRMNSNSYLSLSHHPKILEAADTASHAFGAGPGAVRFIDGTFAPHIELESRIAQFVVPPCRSRLQLRLHHDARTGDHAVRPGHLLDRRRAQSQLHHPGDADRQRPVGAARDLSPQRRRRSRSASLGRAGRHRPGAGDLRRHLLDARRSRAAGGDCRGRRPARGPLQRRHRHDHGRLARPRGLRPDRSRHRGALRRPASTSSSARSARRSA